MDILDDINNALGIKPKQLDVPAVVDDELGKLGYSDNARLALLGNVGRENSWNPDTIFNGHADPKNKSQNRGLLSWQGDRRTGLEKYVKDNGGDWTPNENNLRLQTRYLDSELKNKYGDTYKTLTSPDADLPTISRNLRNYIKYVPTAPYNTPDSDFDVRNNRVWAEKAKQRGLGKFDVSGLLGEIDNALGDHDTIRQIDTALGNSSSPTTPQTPLANEPLGAVNTQEFLDSIPRPQDSVAEAPQLSPNAQNVSNRVEKASQRPRTYNTTVTEGQEVPEETPVAGPQVIANIDVDPKWSDEEKIRFAANKALVGKDTPTGPITPEDIEKWIESAKATGDREALVRGSDPTASVVHVYPDILDQIYASKQKSKEQLGEEAKQRAIAPPTNDQLRQTALQELTTEKKEANYSAMIRRGETPDLNPTEEEIQARVDQLKNAEPSQEQKGTDYDIAQARPSAVRGAYGAAGSAITKVGGLLSPVLGSGNPVSKFGLAAERIPSYANKGEGAQGAVENVGEFLGAIGPQLGELALMPGGAVGKFAGLGALHAAGEGKGLKDIATAIGVEGTKGASFEAANLFKNPLAKLGTVLGGSAVVNTASGMPIDENLKNSVVNTLFEAQGIYGPKIAGQFFKFWKGGEPLTIGVTPKGDVVMPEKQDIPTQNEIVLDPKNEVYKTQESPINEPTEQTVSQPEVSQQKPQMESESLVSDKPAEVETTKTVSHSNPKIDGKEVIAQTADGKVVVANPENKSGVSVVKDRETPETGFDITTQTGPQAKGVGRLKQQRDEALRTSETDPLTGLANRAALDKALPTAEADPNTSVIAFDANNFGKINKEVGQAEGDKALQDIGNAIKKAAEENGVGGRVFRRGGDEFVVLAPKEAADKVRARAEELYGDKKYGSTNVSLSGTVGENFKEADSTLQEAKAARKSATITADANNKPTGITGKGDAGTGPTAEQGNVGTGDIETARTPETSGGKPSKVGRNIEARTIADDLTKGFNGTAEYDPITVKEQSQKAADLVNNDLERAKRIVGGRESVPSDMRAAPIIDAVERYARTNKDVELLRELAQSPLTSETSRHAQELRLLRERHPNSPVKIIQEVQRAREARTQRRGIKPEQAREKLMKEIKAEIRKATPKPKVWTEFVESLKCK